MAGYMMDGFTIEGPSFEVPGALVPLRPTAQEIRMALDFPDDSPMVREWVGAGTGRVVLEQLVEGDQHFGDPSWRQGRVIDHEGATVSRFEYRAEMPGTISRGFFSALGWVMGSSQPPRGWLSGRIVPDAA